MNAISISIFSYAWNGSNWEWTGNAWDADEFSTDGDFSAFDDGEPIRLAATDDSGETAAERIGVVRGGEFVAD